MLAGNPDGFVFAASASVGRARASVRVALVHSRVHPKDGDFGGTEDTGDRTATPRYRDHRVPDRPGGSYQRAPAFRKLSSRSAPDTRPLRGEGASGRRRKGNTRGRAAPFGRRRKFGGRNRRDARARQPAGWASE